MRELYPEITPYNSFKHKVSDIHEILVEESGNPEGKPVIFLHGGPGGGIEPVYRQYFNPEKWRIIIFDQRGCGQSTPHAELADNTTWDLVDDIEKIREIAVSVFSPPDNKLILESFFPGGLAYISIPVCNGSSEFTNSRCALPPLKNFLNKLEKFSFTLSNAFNNLFFPS